MSKPWSQGGIPPAWPEWHALARNYLVGLVVVALMIFLAGFQCARQVARPDPAIAHEAQRTAAYRDSLRVSRQLAQSLAQETAVLHAKLAVDEAHAAKLHAEAARRSDGITIDTVATAAVALLDSANAPVDTVAYADLQRANDERHYLIPRFFAQAYVAKVNEATAWQQVAETQHALVETYQDRAGRDSTQIFYSDSLNASLTRQVDALNRQHRGPFCQFKCGVVVTLSALTAAAITLHEVRR